MKRKEKMIIIIAAVLVLVLAVVLFVVSNYRGEDGFTHSKRNQIEKNGEGVEWDSEEDGFFARLFNNSSDDKMESDTTSTSNDKKDNKNDSTPDKNDSSDDAKKPASNDNKDTSGSDKDNDTSSDNSKDDSDSNSDDSSDKADSGKDDNTPVKPAKPSGNSEYEKYMAMSPEQQEAFFETFDSPEAFIKWFNKAKAEYEASNDSIVVEGGGIDIGDYQ